jgi:hypothetical protein
VYVDEDVWDQPRSIGMDVGRGDEDKICAFLFLYAPYIGMFEY